jgi:CHAD domain-containing protein
MKNTHAILQRTGDVFFSQWEELLRLRQIVLKSCEHEDIHDLRVASRRFRAALYLLRLLGGGSNVQKVSKAVRTLTRTLGDLRNLDESLVFFGSRAGQLGLTGLMSSLAAIRDDEQREIVKSLKRFKPGKVDKQVRDIVAGISKDNIRKPDMPPLLPFLSNTSISLFETIQTLLPAALGFKNCEERHALRIAIKKLRYFLEIVSGIMERDYATSLEHLKKYQSLLGSMNDMTVFAAMCRKTGAPADELAAAAQLIDDETKRLFAEFTALVEAEPLSYTFQI